MPKPFPLNFSTFTNNLSIFRVQCRYTLRQSHMFTKMFKNRGDPNLPMQGEVETKEEWARRMGVEMPEASKKFQKIVRTEGGDRTGEVRNFR